MPFRNPLSRKPKEVESKGITVLYLDKPFVDRQLAQKEVGLRIETKRTDEFSSGWGGTLALPLGPASAEAAIDANRKRAQESTFVLTPETRFALLYAALRRDRDLKVESDLVDEAEAVEDRLFFSDFGEGSWVELRMQIFPLTRILEKLEGALGRFDRVDRSTSYSLLSKEDIAQCLAFLQEHPVSDDSTVQVIAGSKSSLLRFGAALKVGAVLEGSVDSLDRRATVLAKVERKMEGYEVYVAGKRYSQEEWSTSHLEMGWSCDRIFGYGGIDDLWQQSPILKENAALLQVLAIYY